MLGHGSVQLHFLSVNFFSIYSMYILRIVTLLQICFKSNVNLRLSVSTLAERKEILK